MISSPVSISRCVHIHYKLNVVIMPQQVLVRGPQDSENVDKNLEILQNINLSDGSNMQGKLSFAFYASHQS